MWWWLWWSMELEGWPSNRHLADPAAEEVVASTAADRVGVQRPIVETPEVVTSAAPDRVGAQSIVEKSDPADEVTFAAPDIVGVQCPIMETPDPAEVVTFAAPDIVGVQRPIMETPSVLVLVGTFWVIRGGVM